MSNRDHNTPETAIDDLEEALDQLICGHKTEATLHTDRRCMEPPRIVRDHFGGHYDVWFASSTYYVTKEIAEKLKGLRYVDGKKEWGGTDPHKCKINSAGKFAYMLLKEEREEKARGAQKDDQNEPKTT